MAYYDEVLYGKNTIPLASLLYARFVVIGRRESPIKGEPTIESIRIAYFVRIIGTNTVSIPEATCKYHGWNNSWRRVLFLILLYIFSVLNSISIWRRSRNCHSWLTTKNDFLSN